MRDWGSGGREGEELTAQGGSTPVEVDDGAVDVLVRVCAMTSTGVVEARRRRRKDVSERMVVYLEWMVRVGDGCCEVKV